MTKEENMTMNEYQVVERIPKGAHRPGRTGLAAALKTTLETGKAIRIPLNGESAVVMRGRIHSGSSGSYHVRTRLDGDAIVAWLEEKLEEKHP